MTLSGCKNDTDATQQDEISQLRNEIHDLKRVRVELKSLKEEIDSLKNLIKPGQETSLQTKPQSEARAALANSETTSAPITRDITWNPDDSHIDDPVLGAKDAPLIIMAFSDFECQRCSEFWKSTMPELRREFIDNKKVRFILRDLPLPSHPHAEEAARFANCAGQQGKYWEAADLLYNSLEAVRTGAINELKGAIGELNVNRFNRCIAKQKFQTEFEQDINEARTIGAQGVPGFFVGHKVEEHFEGIFIRGAQPFGVFRDELIAMLRN